MKYQKIPNLFQIDLKSKHYDGDKYDNEYLDWVFNSTSKLWVAEKLDGTNIRVCWDGYNISFKGRTDEAQIPDFLLSKLNEMFDCKDTVFERLFGEKQVVLFGEGIGFKIQNSKLDTNDFVLFDVSVNGTYIAKVESLQGIAKEFDIPIVEYKQATLDEVLLQCVQRKNTKSEIVQNTFEGYVVRPLVALYDNQGHRITAKIKAKYL